MVITMGARARADADAACVDEKTDDKGAEPI